MKLGILKTDTVRPEWVPRYGEYPDMFVRLLSAVDPTLQFQVYDVEQSVYPSDINAVDAYLITGSKSSVYDDKAWIQQLQEFVRELHQRRKKLVGICFGHQLIAQALGGKTEKSERGWGVGLHTYSFTQTPQWHDGKDVVLDILVSHQDQVVALPPDAEVIAGSEFCTNAVVQIGQHILTFQGHPEFIADYAREIMTFRRERIGEEAFQQGIKSLVKASQSERVARWILNFLQAAQHSDCAELPATQPMQKNATNTETQLTQTPKATGSNNA